MHAPRLPRALRSTTLACALALVLPLSLFAEAETPAAPATVPRLAAVPIDDVLKTARAHLAASPGEAPDREIVGAQFIPPHGRAGPGFWLVDLAPYPADRPTPARAFTSLLIGMDGKIEERGGRRPLDTQETIDRDQRAATLRARLQQSTPASTTR